MSINGLGTSTFVGLPVDSTAAPASRDGAATGLPIAPAVLDNLSTIDTTRTSTVSLLQDLGALRKDVLTQLEVLMAKQGLSPLQRQEIKARVEQQFAAGITKIMSLAEKMRGLEHPGSGTASAQRLQAAITQLMEGMHSLLGSLPAAQPAIDLDSLPRPTDLLALGRLQAGVAAPGGATAQDKAVGQAMTALPRTPAQLASLQQTRVDLGRVRIELAQDMALMKDSGLQLTEGQMRSLQDRMGANIRKAGELEAKLAVQLPTLKPQIDALSQERAQLTKDCEAAIRTLYKMKDDPATSLAAFAKAQVATNAAILRAAERQSVLTARMDAMMGVMSPLDYASGQLQDAFNQIAAIKASPIFIWNGPQQLRQVESTIALQVQKLAVELGGDEPAAMEIAGLMRQKVDLARDPLRPTTWLFTDPSKLQKQVAEIDKQISNRLGELQAQMAQARRPPAGPIPPMDDPAVNPAYNDAPPRQDTRDDTIEVPASATPRLS